jgi:hypothetical protein
VRSAWEFAGPEGAALRNFKIAPFVGGIGAIGARHDTGSLGVTALWKGSLVPGTYFLLFSAVIFEAARDPRDSRPQAVPLPDEIPQPHNLLLERLLCMHAIF